MDGNLFSPDYTQGNLAEIDFIAQLLGRLSVIVISIVGFGIVIFTILKNAMHGLYAVSPKFWDRVDEAKKASLSVSGNNGGNQIQKVVGSISIVILNLLPNVKAMTDFEDEQIDPKAYFMKSIPVACIQIFIGVFIFFGYPARVAEKFSDFGRNMIDVVLLNVDPVAWVQALPDKFLMLNLSTDGSTSKRDQVINKMAREVYNAYVGTLTDTTKDARNAFSKEIEAWVEGSCIPEMGEYIDTDAYTVVINARVVLGQPDLTKVHNMGTDKLKTFAFSVPIDNWQHGSALETANMYLRTDVTCTKKAQNNTSLTAVTNVLTVPTSRAPSKGMKSYTITVSDKAVGGYTLEAASGASGMVNGIKCQITTDGRAITATAGDMNKTELKGDVTAISGLYYMAGDNRHRITTIIVSGTGAPVFTPETATDIAPWAYGDAPKLKEDTSSPNATPAPSPTGNNQTGIGK